jgi:glycerate 2-kinase
MATSKNLVPPPHKTVVLICPTAYKGTLSPSEAAHEMARAVKKSLPQSTVVLQPVADGGDGTLEVFLHTFSGRKLTKKLTGPMGRPVLAAWGLIEK